MDQPTIEYGSKVSLAYTLSLADGMEVDSATIEKPVVFVVGDGSLANGLENWLVGLAAGEKRNFLIPADDTFGVRDEANIHTVSLDAFDPSIEMEPGLVIAFGSPSGEEVPATIVEVEAGEAKVDFNHPLAGRDLQFDVEILDVTEPE